MVVLGVLRFVLVLPDSVWVVVDFDVVFAAGWAFEAFGVDSAPEPTRVGGLNDNVCLAPLPAALLAGGIFGQSLWEGPMVTRLLVLGERTVFSNDQ